MKKEEKTLQLSYNVNSFKITMWYLQTTAISFFWQFRAKWILMQTGHKQFILCYFVTGFLTLSGKTNGIQTNAGHDNTEHASAINLAYMFP